MPHARYTADARAKGHHTYQEVDYSHSLPRWWTTAKSAHGIDVSFGVLLNLKRETVQSVVVKHRPAIHGNDVWMAA